MRIVARGKLVECGKRFPDAKAQLDAWWAEARRAVWTTPADITARYRRARLLAGGRVVFGICGHKYRLVVQFDGATGTGLVRFAGTCQAYDRIDAATI